jgi:flagellar hook protein FlgE
VPGVIKLSNAFLPARKTESINYQANLPQLPKTSAYRANVPNSELLRAADYDPTATFTAAQSVSNAPWATAIGDLDGDTLTISVGGTPYTYHFQNGGALPTNNASNMYIDISAAPTDTPAGVVAAINTHMQGRTGAGGSAVALDGTGNLTVNMPANSGVSLVVNATDGGGTSLGFTTTQPTSSVPQGTPVDFIPASYNTLFESNSIYGGAITVYAENGAPAAVTLRWAKVNSPQATSGAADTWHLYYMSDSNAAGGETKWTRVNETFQFAANGSLSSPTDGATTLTGLSINGIAVGDVEMRYDNGMSQFADVNGTANVSTINQDGYAAGQFVSVAINDSGRVVATYSNGERIDMAQVVTAEFNAINKLKRHDGGVFSATSESGEALLDISGSGIIGGALEASNTDISDEFTKLIVTQQAYAAGTRIVSTADEMLQEALNMVR